MGMQAPKQTAPMPAGSMGFDNSVLSRATAPQLNPIPFNPIAPQIPQAVPFAAAPNAVPKANTAMNRQFSRGGGGVNGARGRGIFPGLERY